MSKVAEYRQRLREKENWIPFLRKESGLPGPRGNLELAYAVAEEGNRKLFEELLSFQAEENTPEVFLVFCGLVGLGKLAAQEPKLFEILRKHASDPRWRVREAVATGLQLTGDQNMDLLLQEMKMWSTGNWYEKRAAAAALAEPRLLKEAKHAKDVLKILDEITASMETSDKKKDDSYKVLRKAMGYSWSITVVALPETGKTLIEKWLKSTDKDISWILKENLKKNRMRKMDASWVKECMKSLE